MCILGGGWGGGGGKGGWHHARARDTLSSTSPRLPSTHHTLTPRLTPTPTPAHTLPPGTLLAALTSALFSSSSRTTAS